MLDKFVSIIWAIIKNPYEYFSTQMPKDNLVREPIILAVIASTIASLIFYLGYAFTAQAYGTVLLIAIIVFVPISTFLSLYAGAFITHCVIFLFCPKRSNFNQTLKVLAYSSTTNIFLVVPIIGAVAAAIFQIRSIIFGLSAVHNVSALKIFTLFVIVPFIFAIITFALIFAAFGATFTTSLMSYYNALLSGI